MTHRSKHPLYNVWRNMIARCTRKTNPAFYLYGALGVKVHLPWQSSFETFLADMPVRPKGDYSIDRHPDRNGNYEPGNVRWATRAQQAHNLRTTKLTDALVHQIRKRLARKESRKSVAKDLQVSRSLVSLVGANKIWKTKSYKPLPWYKLSESDVREIIKRHKRGERGAALARRFKISPAMVSMIISGKTWKEIPR